MAQEKLDDEMTKTGTLPVADSLNRLPERPNGEREFPSCILFSSLPLLSCFSHKSVMLTYSSPFRLLVKGKTKATVAPEEEDEEAELEKLKAEMAM